MVLGIAQAIAWASLPLFMGHFGKQYAFVTRTEKMDLCEKLPKSEEDYACRFSGLFFSIESGYLVRRINFCYFYSLEMAVL